MLSVTCDAFIHTLDECVKFAARGSSQSLLLLSPTTSIPIDGTSECRQIFSEINSMKFVILLFSFNLIAIVYDRSQIQ